jgi:hypothetical protein
VAQQLNRLAVGVEVVAASGPGSAERREMMFLTRHQYPEALRSIRLDGLIRRSWQRGGNRGSDWPQLSGSG